MRKYITRILLKAALRTVPDEYQSDRLNIYVLIQSLKMK